MSPVGRETREYTGQKYNCTGIDRVPIPEIQSPALPEKEEQKMASKKKAAKSDKPTGEKLSKAAFAKQFPNLSAKEIVEKAKAAGYDNFRDSDVYSARQAKAGKAKGKPGRPKGKAKAPATDLDSMVKRAGLERAIAILQAELDAL